MKTMFQLFLQYLYLNRLPRYIQYIRQLIYSVGVVESIWLCWGVVSWSEQVTMAFIQRFRIMFFLILKRLLLKWMQSFIQNNWFLHFYRIQAKLYLLINTLNGLSTAFAGYLAYKVIFILWVSYGFKLGTSN